MFEIEILHNLHGDKRKKIDTSTEAGRAEAATICKKMLKQGTAIFLERGKKTYRVKDYDPEKDQLIVAHETKGDVKAKATKGKKTAVAPVAGGAGESRMADEETVPVELDNARLRAAGIRSEQQCQQIIDDLYLTTVIQDLVEQMGAYVGGGGEVTPEDMHALVNDVATDMGCVSGVPFPSAHDVGRRLVMARGVPLGFTEMATRREISPIERQTRNMWTRTGPDETVFVLDTDEGPMWYKTPHYGSRMRKLVDTALVRSGTQQTAAAEMKAMRSLRRRISHGQYESYVLNGLFPEKSKHSNVHYVFRKGFPTLAFSYNKSEGGKLLAALCLHPMGYYEGTFCGLMTPTDEVIAHLVMMRSDEHRYWAKSGQWGAMDLRSGL